MSFNAIINTLMAKTKKSTQRQIILKTSLLKRVVFLSLYLAICSSIFTAFAASRISDGKLDERALAVVNLFLLGAATVLSIVIAKRFTRGLSELSAKVVKLGPGHWEFRRTVASGDEVELLDAVVADLTHRLRDTFWGLQGEIDARTEEVRMTAVQDRTILSTIGHGVLLFGADGRVTAVNPAGVHLIGLRKDAIVGASAAHIFHLHARRKDLSGTQHPVSKAMTTRQRYVTRPETRLSIVRPDGTMLPVFLAVSPITEHGRCTGGIVVFQDITEERQVDYMKSEFISLASHQLRTPLSSLRWYVELLRDAKGARLSAEQRSYIHEMDLASRRMSDLVDALLQVSRLEGGGISPMQSVVNLAQFVREVVEDANILGKDHGVSVAATVPPRPFHIHTDPTLLSIVLQNLLSNAVKYSRKGGVVQVTLWHKKGMTEITVKDNGIGIPRKEQQHLFQKLFRANNVGKVDATGSGLGLYISKMVMDALGGTIRLKSAEDKGTEVTIRLPLKPKKKCRS
jgi:two-component system sensor histidine kinase VicK